MKKNVFNVFDQDDLGLQAFVIAESLDEAKNVTFRYFNSSGFITEEEEDMTADELTAVFVTAGSYFPYEEEGYPGMLVTGCGDVETNLLQGVISWQELEIELKKQSRFALISVTEWDKLPPNSITERVHKSELERLERKIHRNDLFGNALLAFCLCLMTITVFLLIAGRTL